MHHIKLIVAILLLNSSAFAQKNLFIQPYIGAGTTGALGGEVSSVIQKNITSVTAGINLGKSFGRLHINTGAAFLTRGFMWDNLSFESRYGIRYCDRYGIRYCDS